MGIHQLNHAVLYVRDLRTSVAFYTDVLGFTVDAQMQIPGAAFLVAEDSTNDHDLGLFQLPPGAAATTAGRGTAGLYHLAWEVDTLADLSTIAGRLQDAGALSGASDHGTSKSLYGEDPDGIGFEIVWLVPKDQIDDEVLGARTRIGRLDLAAVAARHGPQTPGGVGISR